MAEAPVVKFESYFGIAATSFRSLGLNPYFECKEETPKVRQWINFVHFHFCFWVLVVSTIFELIFCCTVFGEKELLMDFCRSISCAIFDIMGIEEYLLMWLSGYKFNEFILQLEQMFPNDRETQERYGVAKQAEDTIRLLRTLSMVYFLCIFIWVVGSPVYDILIAYYSETTYIFELPFKMWFPYDLTEPLWFYVALVMQFDTIYASVMMILAINSLFVSIIAQIGLQFDMLAQNFRELAPNDTRGLVRLTVFHNHLIDICQQFSGLLSRTVFLNHLLSSLALCFGLFQVLTSDTSEIFRFVVYLVCVLIQTFNMSFVGDQLIEHVRKRFRVRRANGGNPVLFPTELENCICGLPRELDELQQPDATDTVANNAPSTEATSGDWNGILHHLPAKF